jgi:hypothetical protein
MDVLEKFTQWSEARGVKRNGVAAHRFAGRGMGIVAERRIEVRRCVFCIVLRWFIVRRSLGLYYTALDFLCCSIASWDSS